MLVLAAPLLYGLHRYHRLDLCRHDAGEFEPGESAVSKVWSASAGLHRPVMPGRTRGRENSSSFAAGLDAAGRTVAQTVASASTN